MFRAHRAAAGVLLACFAGWPALCGGADDPASKAPEIRPPELRAPERPFIALVLPLAAREFASAAAAVAAGCTAAIAATPDPLALQVHRTDATADSILTAYRSAAERGALVVVGPMTRDGVAALARNAPLGPPTLALNIPDADTPLPERFFLFGLSAEAEARVVAKHARDEGARAAVVVHTAGPLSRRMAQAFSAEWQALGAPPPDMVSSAGGLASIREHVSRARPDMVFLAGDADEARVLRPYVGAQVPAYAISLVNSGRSDALSHIDLNGVRFVDMPWMVQPDHPAVMVFPRNTRFGFAEQRFYALGIDACRLAPLIGEQRRIIQLDGVTGQLRLRGPMVEREPVAATFRDGAVTAIEEEAPR